VGVELLLAAQALTMTEHLLPGFQLGEGTQAAYDEIRKQIPACLEGDRWFHNDIQVAHSFVTSGSVREAVTARVGEFV
jgi:histidine ammonia-lyase